MANPQMPAEEMARKVEFIETKLNGTAHAIIPCIDLPMHVHPDTINEVPMAILGAEKGVFTLASERDTKAGQEWGFSYVREPINPRLIFEYGLVVGLN